MEPLVKTVEAVGALEWGRHYREPGRAIAGVRRLQQALQVVKLYPGRVDGDFRKNTDAAVRIFQTANNVTVDGSVGYATAALVDKIKLPDGDIEPPEQWPDVFPYSTEYYHLAQVAKVRAVSIAQIERNILPKLRAGMERYHAVERKTGVPRLLLAALHMREASCDFRCVMHNGERIIGTGVKTRLVPAGRGPFTTWEQAALDAIAIDGLGKVNKWSFARALYESEKYNGFGYRKRGVKSAYVWSFTNIYQGGKYVADGVWSATAIDVQCGTAAMMSRMLTSDPSLWIGE